MKHTFEELVDIQTLQELTDELYAATGIPSAIIATDGKVLTGSGWQRICTDFHRTHPDIQKECIESDTTMHARMAAGDSFAIYRCPRGLVDASAPIFIEGEHLANVFAGQLFTEPPDAGTERFFRTQARRFGLDEEAYLEAFREVPVFPEERFRLALSFLARLARAVASLGLGRLRELETMEQLRAAEHTYRIVADNTYDWEFWFGAAGDFRYVSPSCERVCGHAAQEFRDDASLMLRIIHPDDQELFRAHAHAVARDQAPAVLQFRILRSDGEERWIEHMCGPVFGDDGAFLGTRGSNRDITERRLAEEALRESEERYRRLFELESDAIVLVDSESGRVLEVNSAMTLLYGYSREEWLSMNHTDVSVEPDSTRRTALEGTQVIPVRWHRKKDGTVFPVEITASHFEWQGRTVHVAAIRDITAREQAEEERLRLERQVQQSQRLESLGVLAGGIAHDFNNILTAILGNADLALSGLPSLAPARENLLAITGASRRAADLCRQMLAYSGRGQFVIEVVDLGSLVRDMVGILQSAVSKKARLVLHLEDGLPPLRGDASQLSQVVLNLVINAAEALGEEDGVITIATGVRECPREYLDEFLRSADLPPGRYLTLEVSDTGCGMDSQTKDRLFEPFYSTKFAGRGLGLAAVQGIVKGHRGALRFHSDEGRGSTFIVFFPAEGEAARLAPSQVTATEEWRGRGTALLVDDEEAIRAVGRRMLERLGFQVLTAEDGCQALEVYRRQGPEISVVLLDLTMPRMDGEETFRELRSLDPEACVVLSSGYTEQDTADRFRDLGLAGFVQKPYTLEQLREQLQAALGADIVSEDSAGR